MAYTEHQIIHERGDRRLNTDTYQSALESTKDSIEDVNKAIGFSLGSLTLEKLITSAITLVICIVCIWIIMRIARRISSHSRLSESLSRFILKVLKITLEFMAILIVADSLGFNVTALLAVFSLLGLALSLSVQNCLSNAMSGIIILLTRPFEDGDFIEAGNVSGTVRDIGLIYTQLCTIDNKDIYVPNSDLSASKIVNYNREPQRRVDLTFGADYTCRPEQVKAALDNGLCPASCRSPSRLCACRATARATSTTPCVSGARRPITGRCTMTSWRPSARRLMPTVCPCPTRR